MSEIYYKKIMMNLNLNKLRLLIEGWNAEIIVTTFVQLFHTFVSNCNKSIRKFHRLANSIIILDEIQSIPVRYWKLTETLLKEISEYFNTI